MYLIHIHLAPHPDGLGLPPDTASAVAGAAGPGVALRHVTVHLPDGSGTGPVVGLYLAAADPESAAATARAVWWGAVAAWPPLGSWPFLHAELVLALS